MRTVLSSLILWVFLFHQAIGADRPANWAQPVPGVRNLHKITEQLYRCAQPTPEEMATLEKMGIKTVINLRDIHNDIEKAQATRLRLLHIEMSAQDIETERIARVLALLRETEHAPFVIHCQHGADRTGVVCAMYRMVEQGWSRDDAIQEMREGGYGFHSVWINIVRYLRNVDVEKVRKRVDELSGKI